MCPLPGVWGCAPFLSFLAPPLAAQKGKKYFGDTPIPDRGRLPSALPLLKRQYEHFRFQKKFGMTHNAGSLTKNSGPIK